MRRSGARGVFTGNTVHLRDGAEAHAQHHVLVGRPEP